MNWLDKVFSSPVRVKVLRVVARRGGLSGRSIASAAGVAPSAAKRALDELEELGLVRRGGSKGVHRFYLSESHWLARDLVRLYEAEAGLPHRVADVLQREIRAARVPTDVVAVGVGPDGRVEAACHPRAAGLDGIAGALGAAVAAATGLRLGRILWDPSEAPDLEWVWMSRASGARVAPESRFLKYFGIDTEPEGDGDG